jgi:hypothetical protein
MANRHRTVLDKVVQVTYVVDSSTLSKARQLCHARGISIREAIEPYIANVTSHILLRRKHKSGMQAPKLKFDGSLSLSLPVRTHLDIEAAAARLGTAARSVIVQLALLCLCRTEQPNLPR